jgi:hypothetical protein
MFAVAAFVFAFGIAAFIAPHTADYKVPLLHATLGSTGCQPVLFGSLPKSSSNVLCVAILQPAGVVGKLPTATPKAFGVLPRVRLYTRERRRPALRVYFTGLRFGSIFEMPAPLFTSII